MKPTARIGRYTLWRGDGWLVIVMSQRQASVIFALSCLAFMGLLSWLDDLSKSSVPSFFYIVLAGFMAVGLLVGSLAQRWEVSKLGVRYSSSLRWTPDDFPAARLKALVVSDSTLRDTDEAPILSHSVRFRTTEGIVDEIPGFDFQIIRELDRFLPILIQALPLPVIGWRQDRGT